MEYVIFAVVAGSFILLLMIKGHFDYRKETKRFIKSLYEDYGKLPKREYKAEQFANIPHYYEKHKNGFSVDDITWNDLNMDEVFKKMNYTYSAAGEEYLYYTLRTPSFSKAELDRKEELIHFFEEHADERVACQFLFHKLGRTGKFSIYDYLDYLDNLGERSNVKHYLSLLAVLITIGIMFMNLPVGLFLLIIVFSANVLTYFKIKSEVDPYITSFAYIFKLLDLVDEIGKVKIPMLKDEMQELKQASKELSNFKRGSFLLMSAGRMAGSSDPFEIIVDYLRMAFHLDLIQFNRMLAAVRKHVKDIDNMITIIGMIETMIAIGAFRERNKEYCVPGFLEERKIDAKNLYHPLLDNPIKNDICTNNSILITGSNASGKSTFLKTVALNQILAQTIHTCMADSYETSFYRVLSSMALRDDLQGGESYYMVEIKSLKRIMDAISSDGAPVLCFVDEVLRGTNTVERIAASVQILKSLTNHSDLCFAATHDIELTHLLKEEYDNYHFKEEIEENDIFFSYKILNGRAQSRNAIKLLGIMGYPEAIIGEAENLASAFLKTGDWKS